MKFILETDSEQTIDIIKQMSGVKLVDIDKHTPYNLGIEGKAVIPELIFHDEESNGLCLAVKGEAIAGQRGLSINSNVGEVINVDVNFILTKIAFNSLIDKTD